MRLLERPHACGGNLALTSRRDLVFAENSDQGVEPAPGAPYSSILAEHDVGRGQRESRRKLLREISKKKFNGDRGPNAAVAYLSRGPLHASDIPVLGNVLLGIGDVNTLNLILQSPGGDGTLVEKFVALCRTQCKKFRVIIPNDAKSAATLISLGADEIVMGPPSGLGPIDAQVEVLVSGVSRLVSAQSFIDARDEVLKKHAEAAKKEEDTTASLTMLASMDLFFISECERLMEFGRDVARKLLLSYMFSRKKDNAKKVEHVVKALSSVKQFKVHGQSIDGNTARRDLNLNVRLLGQGDPLWGAAWGYYTRAGIAMSLSQAIKMFETEGENLILTTR